MKKAYLVHSSCILFLFLLVGCSDSSLKEKVLAFEKANPNQSNLDIEVVELQEAGNITGADSLTSYFTSNLTDTGLAPEAMVEWTPDSMITHYSKMVNYYKTSIGAFTYSASTDAKPDIIAQYKKFENKYKAELTDDSIRLSKLTFFDANKDSVLALRYECQLKLSNPVEKNSPQEVTKIVAFSIDKSLVLGSVLKGN